jgi:hypothetical protein
MKKALFLSTLIGLFLIVGCATTTGPKNLTRDIISQQIIKGKTTKEQVKALLGKPYTVMITDYQMPKKEVKKRQGGHSLYSALYIGKHRRSRYLLTKVASYKVILSQRFNKNIRYRFLTVILQSRIFIGN